MKNTDYISLPSSSNTCSVHIISNPSAVAYSQGFFKVMKCGYWSLSDFYLHRKVHKYFCVLSRQFVDISQLPFHHWAWVRLRFRQKICRLPILEKSRDSSCRNFFDPSLHRDKDSYADCQVNLFFFFCFADFALPGRERDNHMIIRLTFCNVNSCITIL